MRYYIPFDTKKSRSLLQRTRSIYSDYFSFTIKMTIYTTKKESKNAQWMAPKIVPTFLHHFPMSSSPHRIPYQRKQKGRHPYLYIFVLLILGLLFLNQGIREDVTCCYVFH